MRPKRILLQDEHNEEAAKGMWSAAVARACFKEKSKQDMEVSRYECQKTSV